MTKKLPTKAFHGRSKNEVLFLPPHVFASVTYKLVPQGREGGNVATNPAEASLSSIGAPCDITKGRIAQLTKEKDDLFPFSWGCSTGHKHVTNRKHCLQISNMSVVAFI